MGHYHQVGPGETLRTIASAYGLPWREIWEHAKIFVLRDTRSPGTLEPGDEVWIPADASAPSRREPGPVPFGLVALLYRGPVTRAHRSLARLAREADLPAGATNEC